MASRYISFLALCEFFAIAHAFVAFEYGEVGANNTAISLLDVAGCSVETEIVDESEVVVQLLQPREVREVHAYSCKISVDYLVSNCGMHSHNSVVQGGVVSKLLPITKNECYELQKTGDLEMGHMYSEMEMRVLSSLAKILP